MERVVYLKIKQNVIVTRDEVRLRDLAQYCCSEKGLEGRLGEIWVCSFSGEEKKRVLSIMEIVRLIRNVYPDMQVENMGETEFIVERRPQKESNMGKKSLKQRVATGFVAVFTFIGSSYAIMAYNNDVGAEEIFDRLYDIFGATGFKDGHLIETCYALGLFIGIAVFYNHFSGNRPKDEPAPIQVEMDKYEKDIDSAYIEMWGSEDGKK